MQNIIPDLNVILFINNTYELMYIINERNVIQSIFTIFN